MIFYYIHSYNGIVFVRRDITYHHLFLSKLCGSMTGAVQSNDDQRITTASFNRLKKTKIDIHKLDTYDFMEVGHDGGYKVKNKSRKSKSHLKQASIKRWVKVKSR